MHIPIVVSYNSPYRRVRLLAAWLLAVTSGALATSLLRVPVGIVGIGSTALVTHIGVGAVLGILICWWLQRAGQRSRIWPAAAVIATLAAGWFARRSFAPVTGAAHAALAAITTAALVAVGSAWRPRSWKAYVAGTGFLLLCVQAVIGAFLRHQLVSLSWHVLVAGLAALTILVPAVAIAQDSRSSPAEKRASTWAISSVLVQVALGVVILVMMMLDSANAGVWLVATVTHVVVGNVTLLAAWELAVL
jgi:hypothetical protein